MRALLLTGGGARGAYQAGVMKGLSEIVGGGPRALPFPILTGMSAGAINLMVMAGKADDFHGAAAQVERMWAEISLEQVFQTDFFRTGKIAFRWLRNLAFGGAAGYDRFSGLLNPKPLRLRLEQEIDFPAIRRHLAGGRLDSLAVLVSHYTSGAAVTFIESGKSEPPSAKGRRVDIYAPLELSHVMASSALPLIFPPVQINGHFFGDGSVRMSHPFSPAIHLGATSILAVSVRKPQPGAHYLAALERPDERPTVGGIAGSLLNSVFMDALDGDLDRLERFNEILARARPEPDIRMPRPIRALVLAPSEDLGALSRPYLARFPANIRYLLKGIGADKPGSTDFLSYICFDRDYCRELIALGRADALERRDDLRALLEETPPLDMA